jgi:primosomal protein N' (replication factor Y)
VLAQHFPDASGTRLLGPAEPPLALIRGQHRVRLIVKAPRAADLSGLIRDWLSKAPKPKGKITIHIDVDPVSFI